MTDATETAETAAGTDAANEADIVDEADEAEESGPCEVVRPRLKPALRRIARDDRTIQFGLHPQRISVLHDVEPPVLRVIESLDGTRELHQVVKDATKEGLREDQTHTLIGMLFRRGVLDDAAARPTPLRSLTMAERDRLQPDLDAISLLPGTTDGGFSVLERRRAAQVRLYGAGRVGAQVAALLAASGVGNLCVDDTTTARARDIVPGGLGWPAVGESRQNGTVAMVRVMAPGVNAWTSASAPRPADRGRGPDLAILAPAEPLDHVMVGDLLDAGTPHLLVSAFEGFGSIGPLVVPGSTACLRCMELTRRDRDPEWPTVSARLGGYPAGEVACDTVTSAWVAAAAAAQALMWIDDTRSNVMNGTLDVVPEWGWRRRSWRIHPKCRCARNELV
ncbi:thiamine biosynthesis protein ThiF [Spongiactinospora sp. TRM90649]|uniref:ThiF family adenylyltransferase n=1 Tax=Spongiactinospora sp. TRM90649 TaxID=3031114 RepID=UPI0023F84DFD|nr:thiamine biosynthesis protein ThiF [Spongiactinospora sp. TRM90649]MDF5755537.1 thiamine biosynthesis protein ThiF [Spongiactinospora sp. TRM90649]